MDAGEQVSLERGLGEMRGLTSGIRIAVEDLKQEQHATTVRIETAFQEHTIDDKAMFKEMADWMRAADYRRVTDNEAAAEHTLEVARTVARDLIKEAAREAKDVEDAHQAALEAARLAERKAQHNEHWATIRTVAIAVLSAGLGIVGTVIKSYLEHPS